MNDNMPTTATYSEKKKNTARLFHQDIYPTPRVNN